MEQLKRKNTLKCFIIAGEESGDVLGVKIMQALRHEVEILRQNNVEIQLDFQGIGGHRMREEGLHSLVMMEKIACMGVWEVLPKIPLLWQTIQHISTIIVQQQPDVVITVDAPDLSFRIMQKVAMLDKQKKMYRVHVVAPSVWVYRKRRAEKIAKLYDTLFTLLPFEPKYFEEYGLESLFIGHPLIYDYSQEHRICSIEQAERQHKLLTQYCQQYEIPLHDTNTKVIGITPGSRSGEVSRLLPIFLDTIKKIQQKFAVKPLIFSTPAMSLKIKKSLPTMWQDVPVIVNEEEKQSLISTLDLALAKSGTNTFEFMLHQIPLVVAYKFNWLTAFIARNILKIKRDQFANIINVILQYEVIPELIQEKCTVPYVSEAALKLLESPIQRLQQIQEYNKVLNTLGYQTDFSPAERVAKRIMLRFFESRIILTK